MNFFESQDQARQKTKLLIFYFVLAITGIIAAVYLAFLAIFFFASTDQPSFSHVKEFSWWQPEIFFAVAGATIVLVLGSSFGKILSLRSGGQGIATSLGGQLLSRDAAGAKEIQLLNIVEEMAIASGMPVPGVYLLPEEGINAFAAGYSINDAVIGVTKGAVEQLSRDELQGVIAHEFSHILNGDMRLNIHLIGLIFGILVLTIIGRILLRSESRGSRRRGGKDGAGLALFGVALLLIGLLGSFFARLIKSAISRQREFLADAAAVQFTRNPLGIGGALQKILISSDHAQIKNEHAAEASHMFFADSLSSFWSGMLATHPPLEQRIRRLGVELPEDAKKSSNVRSAYQQRSETVASFASGAQRSNVAISPASVVGEIGQLLDHNIVHAQQMIASLSSDLRLKLSDPSAAQAVVIALLNKQGADDKYTLELPEIVTREMPGVEQLIDETAANLRLLMLDLALPTLKQLSVQSYKTFRSAVFHVLDRKQLHETVTSFDYALAATATHNLDIFFGLRQAKVQDNVQLASLVPALEILFQVIVFYAEDTGGDRERVWRGINQRLAVNLPMPNKVVAQMKDLDLALEQLTRLQPKGKQQLLEACIESVFYDGNVKVEEAEIIRAIAETLNCPIPPIVAEAGE